MKQTIYVCDITGEKNLKENDIIKVSIHDGSTPDPSGNGYEENYSDYEFGIRGANELIDFMLEKTKKNDMQFYKQISKFLSEKKNKVILQEKGGK